MFSDIPKATVILIFAALSLTALIKKVTRVTFPLDSYIPFLWIFFLVFSVSEMISFKIAIWILAFLCFIALREYFTLVDFRLQDRWGILGAYLSIPFMFLFIRIDGYGMFIISIPVYSFLVIPFLVTLGGKETEGTVLSIGAIDLGLFFLVYCIGHIGYLSLFSTWKAIMLILTVALCDLIAYLMKTGIRPTLRKIIFQYFASVPATILLALLLSEWTEIPRNHSIILGLLIPVLVAIGRYTIDHIESDLGIKSGKLLPGRGQIIDNIKSLLYAAPVIFHYIRYFLR